MKVKKEFCALVILYRKSSSKSMNYSAIRAIFSKRVYSLIKASFSRWARYAVLKNLVLNIGRDCNDVRWSLSFCSSNRYCSEAGERHVVLARQLRQVEQLLQDLGGTRPAASGE